MGAGRQQQANARPEMCARLRLRRASRAPVARIPQQKPHARSRRRPPPPSRTRRRPRPAAGATSTSRCVGRVAQRDDEVDAADRGPHAEKQARQLKAWRARSRSSAPRGRSRPSPPWSESNRSPLLTENVGRISNGETHTAHTRDTCTPHVKAPHVLGLHGMHVVCVRGWIEIRDKCLE